MNRRRFVTIAGIASATALSGCLSSAEAPQVDELTVEETDRNTIRVTGQGSVETEPDRATVSLAVEASDRDDASVVVEELATDADALKTALLEYGISEDDITTSRYSLREDSRSGVYEGEHRYLVELDDPDSVGEVIDVGVDAGADEIGRINFTVSEERREELYDDAVQKAVDDAREEADLYSSAAGQTLGDPISIETSRTDHRPFRIEYDMAVAEDANGSMPTDIDAGDVSVRAQASIEYEFE